MYKIRIIIVNYKTSALVQNCLTSIEKEKNSKAKLDLQVVIVDNDSNDDSIATLLKFINQEKRSSWVHLLESKKNLGFGAGNNLGFNFFKKKNETENSYLLILNPDLNFIDANLEVLIEFMNSNEKIAILGPTLIGNDQKTQYSGFRFPSLLTEFISNASIGFISKIFKHSQITFELIKESRRVDWIAGAAMLFKPNVYERLNGFDETFFLYFEEVDLCYRLKKLDLEVWQYKESKMLHLVGASTGVTSSDAHTRRRPAYWFFSRKYYYEKNFGLAYRLLCDLFWIIGMLIGNFKNLLFLRKNQKPHLITLDFMAHSLGLRKWEDPRL